MITDQPAKRLVAACLPLGKLFNTVFSEAIEPACREAGVDLERLPTPLSSAWDKAATEDRLRSAHTLVADLSGRNPNVYWQVGFAEALRKRVILISQHGEDLSFDFKNVECVVYASNHAFLKQELLAALRAGQLAAAPTPAIAAVPAAVSPKGPAWAKFEAVFGEILREHGYIHHGNLYLENDTTFVLENQDMELLLVQDLARTARAQGLRLKLL